MGRGMMPGLGAAVILGAVAPRGQPSGVRPLNEPGRFGAPWTVPVGDVGTGAENRADPGWDTMIQRVNAA